MPLNPFENMPTLLTRRADAVDKFFESFNELKVNARANEYMKFPACDNMENGNVFSHFSPPSHPISDLLKQTKVSGAPHTLLFTVRIFGFKDSQAPRFKN